MMGDAKRVSYKPLKSEQITELLEDLRRGDLELNDLQYAYELMERVLVQLQRADGMAEALSEENEAMQAAATQQPEPSLELLEQLKAHRILRLKRLKAWKAYLGLELDL